MFQVALADGWAMAKAVVQRKAGRFANKDYQLEVELRCGEVAKKKPWPASSSAVSSSSSAS